MEAKVRAAGVLGVVACAIAVAARWPGGGASTPAGADGLPAAHPPYRVLVLADGAGREARQEGVRPWPQVLGDIAAHNGGPAPVEVESLAPDAFRARRPAADLVVVAVTKGGVPGLEGLLRQAAAAGATVIAAGVPPLDRPACPVDGAAWCLEPEEPRLPLTREGHQRLAHRLAGWLREQGRLHTAHLYADALDLARAGDGRAELAEGFWGREEYPAGLGGRWTGASATLRLERRGGEGGLVVALSLRHPQRRAGVHVDVGGRAARAVSGPNGRWNLYLDVRDVPGALLPVHLVADQPFVPREHGPSTDGRTLGVLVHAAWLVERPVEPEVDLGLAEEGRLELGPGFWQRERFPDGRVGRWSQREATLLLERRGAERGLVLDVSLEHPDGITAGRVQVGAVSFPFRWENGSRREVLDVGRVAGRQLPIKLIVDTAFQAAAEGDRRTLGLFVHGARLVDDPGAARAALAPAPATVDEGEWPGVTQVLDVAAANDEGPELVSGFGPGEAWPDGRAGRWTFREAIFRLPRAQGEAELVLDLSFQSPWNLTTGWIELGGVRRHRFRSANGPQRLVLDIGDVEGRELEVAIRVDRPFRRPGQGPPGREYGLFLHQVRLARP